MWTNIQMEERERTAGVIRQMHAGLTGEGDTRAAKAFNAQKDPVVKAAIDQPEPVPQGRWPLVRRRRLSSGDGRPALLFAVPWMMIGGVEQVVL